jgi:hypothetical protein
MPVLPAQFASDNTGHTLARYLRCVVRMPTNLPSPPQPKRRERHEIVLDALFVLAKMAIAIACALFVWSISG